MSLLLLSHLVALWHSDCLTCIHLFIQFFNCLALLPGYFKAICLSLWPLKFTFTYITFLHQPSTIIIVMNIKGRNNVSMDNVYHSLCSNLLRISQQTWNSTEALANGNQWGGSRHFGDGDEQSLTILISREQTIILPTFSKLKISLLRRNTEIYKLPK